MSLNENKKTSTPNENRDNYISLIHNKNNLIKEKEEVDEKTISKSKVILPRVYKYNFQDFINCLGVAPSERIVNEVNFLINYFNDNHVLKLLIKNKVQDLNPNAIKKCMAKNMESIKLEKDEILFRVGDQGDKFYLILRGKVSVLLPIKKKTFMTPKEYFEFLEDLFLKDEINLLNNTISGNLETYNFESYDDFLKFYLIKSKLNHKNKFEKEINNKFPVAFHETDSPTNVIEHTRVNYFDNLLSSKKPHKGENKDNNDISFRSNEGFKENNKSSCNEISCSSDTINNEDDFNSKEKKILKIINKKNNDNNDNNNKIYVQKDKGNILNEAIVNARKNKSFSLLAERKIFANINTKNKQMPSKKANGSPIKENIQFREGDAEYNKKTIELNNEHYENFKKNFLIKMVNKSDKIENASENDPNAAHFNQKEKAHKPEINEENNDKVICEKESESKISTKRKNSIENKQSSDSLKFAFLEAKFVKMKKSSEKLVSPGIRLVNYLCGNNNKKLFNNDFTKESVIKKSLEKSFSLLEDKTTHEISKPAVWNKNSQKSVVSNISNNSNKNEQKMKKLKLQNLKSLALDYNKNRIKDNEKLNERLIQSFYMTKEEADLMKKYEFMSDDKEKRKYFVYEYKFKASLTEGFYFGDFALDSDNKKRTATIRSEDNTVLGFINKETYINNIYIENEIIQAKEIKLLNEIVFFNTIKTSFFKKKFFRFFERKDVLKDEIIFEQSIPMSNLIYVREGALEVSFTGSLVDIVNTMKNLLMKFSEKKLIQEAEFKRLKKEFFDKDFRRNFFNTKEFEERINKKKSFSLFILKNKDVVGIESIALEIDSFFKIKVVSDKTSVYFFPAENLRSLCDSYLESKDNFNKYACEKVKVMIKRFSDIKDVILGSLSDFRNNLKNLNLIRNETYKMNVNEDSKSLKNISNTTIFNLMQVSNNKLSANDFNINNPNNLFASSSIINKKSINIKTETKFYKEKTQEAAQIIKQETLFNLKFINNERLKNTDASEFRNSRNLTEKENLEQGNETRYKFNKKHSYSESQLFFFKKPKLDNEIAITKKMDKKAELHEIYFKESEIQNEFGTDMNLDFNDKKNNYNLNSVDLHDKKYNVNENSMNSKENSSSNCKKIMNKIIDIKNEKLHQTNNSSKHSFTKLVKVPIMYLKKPKNSINLINSNFINNFKKLDQEDNKNESIQDNKANNKNDLKFTKSFMNSVKNFFPKNFAKIRESFSLLPPIDSTGGVENQKANGFKEGRSNKKILNDESIRNNNNNFHTSKQMQVLKHKSLIKSRNDNVSELKKKKDVMLSTLKTNLDSSIIETELLEENEEYFKQDYKLRTKSIKKFTFYERNNLAMNYLENVKSLSSFDKNHTNQKFYSGKNTKEDDQNYNSQNNRKVSKETSMYECEEISIDSNKLKRPNTNNTNLVTTEDRKLDFIPIIKSIISNVHSNDFSNKIKNTDKIHKNQRFSITINPFEMENKNIDINTTRFMFDKGINKIDFDLHKDKEVIKSIKNLRDRVKNGATKKFSATNYKI